MHGERESCRFACRRMGEVNVHVARSGDERTSADVALADGSADPMSLLMR
jgi:hypothetical protein